MICLDSFAKTHLEIISKTLSELIPEEPNACQNELFQAARYALLSHGKRLRPLLCIAAGLSFQVPLESLLFPACALEMIHTYSLIHDDLPCMDDDDFRRGKPSLHKAFSEGTAVLAGDFLLTHAFEVLSNAPYLSSNQKIQLIQTLSKRAGAKGMIGGQVIDLASEGQTIDFEILKEMHLAKTAALISCALEFGGIIAQISKEDFVHLNKAGNDLGLAFQFIDDILDEPSQNASSSYDKKNKATALSTLGLEKSKILAKEFFQSALESFKKLSTPCPLLFDLSKKFIYRDY